MLRTVPTDACDIVEDSPPEMYSSYLQVGSYFLQTALVVRTAPQSGDIAKSIREHVQQLDPNQPLTDVLPMRRILNRAIAPQRFIASILAMLAVISLVLAAAGIYGSESVPARAFP
jgi:hypothetical protein